MRQLLEFPNRDPSAAGPGGTGPMDPTVEQRVIGLERKVDRVEAILVRLEPMIVELGFTAVRTTDLNKAQIDLAELKGRISSLPTWWMLLATVLSTWLAGAGIVFTLVKASHP